MHDLNKAKKVRIILVPKFSLKLRKSSIQSNHILSSLKTEGYMYYKLYWFAVKQQINK